MKVLQVLISAVVGASLVGFALSQQSHSTSESHSGNGTNSASASSSSSSNSSGHGSGQQGGSFSGNGSGNGSGMRLPKPTHAIMFLHSASWSQGAYDQIKQARVAYFAQLQQMSKLIYFGPWKDEAGEMSIIVATDQEARQIANNDPAVNSGLETADIRGWDVQVEPYAIARNLGGQK